MVKICEPVEAVCVRVCRLDFASCGTADVTACGCFYVEETTNGEITGGFRTKEEGWFENKTLNRFPARQQKTGGVENQTKTFDQFSC